MNLLAGASREFDDVDANGVLGSEIVTPEDDEMVRFCMVDCEESIFANCRSVFHRIQRPRMIL